MERNHSRDLVLARDKLAQDAVARVEEASRKVTQATEEKQQIEARAHVLQVGLVPGLLCVRTTSGAICHAQRGDCRAKSGTPLHGSLCDGDICIG